MSIMVGSPGSKFIQQDTSGEKTPFKEVNLLPGQLKKHLPPRIYGGLRVGPEMTLEYEDNQALPVDSSMSMLRNLSPFILQVELPTALSNLADPSSKEGATKVFDAAFNASGDNNSASQAVLKEPSLSTLSATSARKPARTSSETSSRTCERARPGTLRFWTTSGSLRPSWPAPGSAT